MASFKPGSVNGAGRESCCASDQVEAMSENWSAEDFVGLWGSTGGNHRPARS